MRYEIFPFPILFMDSMSGTPRKSTTKMLGTFLVVGLLLLVVVVDMQRRAAVAQLAQLSVKLNQVSGGNSAENKAEADRIVAEVRKLMDIATDVEPTVATIVDVEVLRKQNEFYNRAENGDSLIVTPTRAILYSSKNKRIIDVVPVQLEAPAQQAQVQGGQQSSAPKQQTPPPAQQQSSVPAAQ